MKGKTTVILLASVLAAPLGMASLGMADGGGFKLEAEMRSVTPPAEAEVEFGRFSKLIGGVLTTVKKLSAEVELVVDNSLVAGVTSPSITITDPSTATNTCVFTKAPRVEPILGTTFSEVEFHGSTTQIGVASALANGLDCGANIVNFTVGSTVVVTNPALSGILKKD